jgi:hypothetical protein
MLLISPQVLTTTAIFAKTRRRFLYSAARVCGLQYLDNDMPPRLGWLTAALIEMLASKCRYVCCCVQQLLTLFWLMRVLQDVRSRRPFGDAEM